MIKRKYVALLLLVLVSTPLAGILYSSLAQAQSTVTSYVSVPAAAFGTETNSTWGSNPIWWHNTGTRLYNYEWMHDNWRQACFYGVVPLPHRATVTNMTAYWYAPSGNQLDIHLYRYDPQTRELMTYSRAPGFGGDCFSFNDTINHAIVDNSQYSYYLEVRIPFNTMYPEQLYAFKYVVIEYTLPSQAVGGFWIPVDKLSLLAPYIALVSTIILAVSISVAYIKYRKKQ